MPTIPLHLSSALPPSSSPNPLPPLLHTPSGLALLEIQGTIHFPTPAPSTPSTHVGELVFPYHNPLLHGPDDTKWMKRVYLYIGENQRMTGECKKLVQPMAVVRRRGEDGDVDMGDGEREGGKEGSHEEELEIIEIVRYKVVFSHRPEPVGGSEES
jgi:chromosome transmission fidelity protein 8